MPTSEANTATLKNTNAALGTEEAAESSKASVCIIMTQDQCLDNVHQATSNNHSTNDQVSDDLKNSKNNIVSNGINNVQEFNVDVNSKRSEHSANAAIVQNCTVDADSPSAGKVLTSEQSAAISIDFADLKENSDNLISNIDVNKSKCADNPLLPDMTVITHQNSSENIRDIIASSDKINKIPNNSQLTGIVNNVNSVQNLVNGNIVNKSGATRKKLISTKTKHNRLCETDPPEDPVERLNKLRASISNALSEVKGVLKQYSTEQSIDEENESTPSSQPADDGPVRFRFVRKIRRRSVFSEDDDGMVHQNVVVDGVPKIEDHNLTKTPDSKETNSTVSEQKKTDQVPKILQEKLAISSENKQAEINAPSQVNPQNEKAHDEVQKIGTGTATINEYRPAINSNQPSVLKQNINTKTLDEIKQTESSIDVTSTQAQTTLANLNSIEIQNLSTSTPIKTKTVKLKKMVKKDRRASIAAVEINQVSTDKLLPELELKAQRRPSDSGTLVKQSKTKTNEKLKLSSQREVKTSTITKTEVPVVIEPNQTSQLIKKDANITLNELKASEQNKSNPPTATNNAISTSPTTKTAVTVETINTTDAMVSQKQSNRTANANIVQIENSRIEPSIAAAAVKNTELVVENEISNLTDVQTPSESGSLPKQSARMKAKTNEKTKLSSQSHVKTSPVIKTELHITEPIAASSHLIQPHEGDVKKLVSEDSKGIVQNTSNLSTPAHDAISTKLTTDPPVNNENVTITEETVGQNLSIGNNRPKPSKETSILIAVQNNTAAAVNTVELPAKTEDFNATAVRTPQTQHDSKTLAKQSFQGKAKPNEGTKLSPQHQVKTSPVNKNEVLIIVEPINAPSQLSPPRKGNERNLVSEDSKGTVQNTSNPPTPAHVIISTTLTTEAPVKIETVTTAKALVGQNQSTENNKANSKAVTSIPVVLQKKTGLVGETVDLPAIKKIQVSNSEDIQLTQTPKLLTVPDSIESVQPGELKSSDAPNDDVAQEGDAVEEESIAERALSGEDSHTNIQEITPEVATAPPKKKRKAKRKVVIRRMKRKLSRDDIFTQTQETPSELEICEKEIEEKDLDEESEEESEIVPKQPKSCLKARQFEIGDVVMYAERYRKTQVKWRKAIVIERITSISYKLDIEGEEKPAHISYIKKFTDRKVNFGGKEYLEIDYAQIEEDEEKERNYSIWNHV